MSIEVRLPQLGESTTHARLSLWLKKEGERVGRGDVIAEVETDKTSVEIESPGEGVLAKILVPAGTDTVAVDALLAVLDDAAPGEVRAGSLQGAHAALARGGRQQVDQTPTAIARPATAPDRRRPPAGADRGVRLQADPVPSTTDDAEVAASPLARRMAQAAGIPLASIAGTGSGGRIMKDDVAAAMAPRPCRRWRLAVSRRPRTRPCRRTMPPYTRWALSVMRRVSAGNWPDRSSRFRTSISRGRMRDGRSRSLPIG
ncbi:MAG: biotin/lipoyl-containing protein [Vicinamibacterales bacterium]